MSAFEKSVNCKDIAPLLVFYTCDEVSDTERKHIEAHVANCRACATQLAEERSEEHTSELQSQSNLVCRLLLEKKKQDQRHNARAACYTVTIARLRHVRAHD